MNSPFLTSFSLVFGTIAFAAPLMAAEPPRKLVPRAIPGLTDHAEHTKEALSSATAAPAAPATPSGSKAAAAPAGPEKARIVFIHRRSTLPPSLQLRKDAEPAADLSGSASDTTAAPAGARSRVRIIPKSQVTTLLSRPAENPAETADTP